MDTETELNKEQLQAFVMRPGAILHEFKPFRPEESFDPVERGQMQQYGMLWRLVIQGQRPELLKVAQDIYFSVLQHYLGTNSACGLNYISRSMVKRWNALLERLKLPPIKLEEFARGLHLSKTVPIQTMRTPTGGTNLLPVAVVNAIIDRAKRVKPGEKVIELTDVLIGISPGPNLTEKEIELAYMPFPPSDDEMRQRKQLFDMGTKFPSHLVNAPDSPNKSEF